MLSARRSGDIMRLQNNAINRSAATATTATRSLYSRLAQTQHAHATAALAVAAERPVVIIVLLAVRYARAALRALATRRDVYLLVSVAT